MSRTSRTFFAGMALTLGLCVAAACCAQTGVRAQAPSQASAQTAAVPTAAPLSTAAPSSSPSGGPAYVGAPMSLNVQHIEVRAALQAVADFTGLNIVVSDTVTGSLSLRLHQVPWDQVLDLIAQARGLHTRRQGNVIWVAPRAEVAARDKARLEDWQALQNLEPLHTRSYRLHHARAAEVQARLLGTALGTPMAGVGGASGAPFGQALAAAYGQVALPPALQGTFGATPASPAPWQAAPATGALSVGPSGRVLSARGSAVADPRTNQLFVTDVAQRLDQVERMLERLDVPLRQVLIEARIVQASDTFGQTLGVRLSGGGQNGPAVWGTTAAATTANSNPVSGQGTLFQTPDKALNTSGQFVNLPAAGINGVEPASFAVAIFQASKNRLLNLELSALEADGKGKVVSSPRVVTADQSRAVIEQGTELPYQTAAGTGITTIAFRKANLRLEVTPQLTPEGSIVLDLDIHKDSVGQSTPAGFAIDNRHINTQVRVDNGGTVMIGGIYETTQQDDAYKVPLLGDLPLVGALFRNHRHSQAKQELLVFITPKMLEPSAP